MGYIRKVLGLENVEKRSDYEPLKKTYATLFGMSDAGINVNEETALKFSAVWSCVRLLSELPASLPLQVIEDKNGKRIPLESHPAKSVLLYPNDYMNRFTYQELENAFLQLWGNHISIIDSRNSGYPEKLIPVHAKYVKTLISDGKVFYKVVDPDMDIKGPFFSDEVIHFKMFTTNGIWGKSPIQMARENIGLGLAAEKFGSKFFKKGGNIKAVIESENSMGDDDFKEWKTRWDKYYSGEAGDHTTPILEYGMKYKALGIPPEQAQFIATRQFQLQEVARIFNVPPHLLADLSKATFSNIEHQDLQFVKYTLRPILKRKEVELEQKLLKRSEWGKIKIRYNIDGLLRGDLASLTNHIHTMVLVGVMKTNEGRGIINRNPLDGGDERYKPAHILGKEIKN
jgi:HK97 family phage portal protein